MKKTAKRYGMYYNGTLLRTIISANKEKGFKKGPYKNCYKCGSDLKGKRSNWGTCAECDKVQSEKVLQKIKERLI